MGMTLLKSNLDIWCGSLDRQPARRKPVPPQDNMNTQKLRTSPYSDWDGISGFEYLSWQVQNF